jgi:hypothetical protein
MGRNSKLKVDFVAKAHAAWGEAMPKWVRVLAEEANRTNATLAARRIGYSLAVLSHVFSRNYRGDMSKVEARVRGALMGETVTCPVVGEIGRDRCLSEQAMGNTGASSIRAKLFRACRGGCPHSRLTREEG